MSKGSSPNRKKIKEGTLGHYKEHVNKNMSK